TLACRGRQARTFQSNQLSQKATNFAVSVCACRSISTRLFRSTRCTIFFCIFSTRTSRTDSLARRIRANFLFCVARSKHFRTLPFLRPSANHQLCTRPARLPVRSAPIFSLTLLHTLYVHLFHAQIQSSNALL